jgi:hypothetical protein
MEGSSERALEVAPNETLVMGHETTFQNSHDVFEDCAKHGESQTPKLLSCFLQQKILVGISPTTCWGGPSAKLVM